MARETGSAGAAEYDWSARLAELAGRTALGSYEVHTTLPSTNDRALQLVREGSCRLPCLILTAEQTAGRGRGEHAWFSTEGSLTFSLILDSRPWRVAAAGRNLVSLASALAVAIGLEPLLPPEIPPQLKWPNDVFLQGRKLSGILVETVAARPGVLVVGIGINVNNSLAAAAGDLAAKAVALREVRGGTAPLDEVLERVVTGLLTQLPQWMTDPRQLVTAWTPRCLLRGHSMTLRDGTGLHVGVCDGVDVEGALCLRAGNQRRRFWSGEVLRVET